MVTKSNASWHLLSRGKHQTKITKQNFDYPIAYKYSLNRSLAHMSLAKTFSLFSLQNSITYDALELTMAFAQLT